MRKMLVMIVFLLGVTAWLVYPLYADETSDVILEVLIKKGIITQGEVEEMRVEIRNRKQTDAASVPLSVDGDLEERVSQLETQSHVEKKSNVFTADWKDGLRFKSTDGNFQLKIRGRIMTDFAFISEDNGIKDVKGVNEDGAEIRRARLGIAGTIYENIIFKSEYDFVGGDPEMKDLYLGMKDLPAGTTVLIGNSKEPFGLEELTSSKYITFMERALPAVFAPSRNIGVNVSGSALKERMTWAIGGFRDTTDFGEAGTSADTDYNITSRVTGLPFYRDDGKQLIHLGASYSHRYPNEHTVSYSSRPESHLAKKFVDTGDIAAEALDLYGIETALIYGPFSLQGEYIYTGIDGRSNDLNFDGYYAQASYFLTGEHRNYERDSGEFGRIKPKHNFGKEGWGAWETAVRYAALDLNDEDVHGGHLHDLTLGLNWYLNPNTRMMLNYVFTDLKSVGQADIVQSRFQIDF